jgi:hypothetical protein
MSLHPLRTRTPENLAVQSERTSDLLRPMHRLDVRLQMVFGSKSPRAVGALFATDWRLRHLDLWHEAFEMVVDQVG